MSFNEDAFRQWYAEQANKFHLNPNPDDPQHHYDYRAAYSAGIRGPDSTGHWPSTYKDEGHPNLIINGINTKTGAPQMPRLTPEQEKERARIMMQVLGMEDVQTPYALAGGGLQKPEQGPAGMQYPSPEMQAGPQPMPAEQPSQLPETQGGYATPETEGAVTAAPKGGGGWTNAATLALANSMPELIKAAYQRPERPQGRSVGGGKPAFQMADPFGKREKFRSLMAQYLR